MAEAAVDAKWKDRYRELVRDLEDKERHWTSLEAALRAAAGKLALAAMGQGKALDAALEKVVGGTAVRHLAAAARREREPARPRSADRR